jgi:hypothetical protein
MRNCVLVLYTASIFQGSLEGSLTRDFASYGLDNSVHYHGFTTKIRNGKKLVPPFSLVDEILSGIPRQRIPCSS